MSDIELFFSEQFTFSLFCVKSDNWKKKNSHTVSGLSGNPDHMAHEMLAVCSLAFMRSTAMLDDRLSNSGLVSKAGLLAGVRSESALKKLLRDTWPNWFC